MKKPLLKQFWSWSLAAATAIALVPFAPLTVRADTPDPVTTGTTIDEDGSYTLEDGCTSFSISEDVKTVSIDLNGQSVTANLSKAKNADVILTDKGKKSVYADLSIKGGSYVRSLSLAGNMSTGSQNPVKWIGRNRKSAVEDMPVAYMKSTYYVGNRIINAESAGQSVAAVHGDINIAEISEGCSATISADADHDTTITAGTDKGTSLTCIKTEYSYPTQNGSETYTAYAYYAGESVAKNAINHLTPPALIGSIHLRNDERLYSNPTYTRAITISMNGDSWSSPLSEPSSVMDIQDKDEAAAAEKISGITYFTKDPSTYAKGLVACLGGNKYILGENRLKDVSVKGAKSTIKILQMGDSATVSFNMGAGTDVDRKSGFGYYTRPLNSGITACCYGPASQITAKFTAYVSPHKVNGQTVPAEIGANVSATVFASKEIQTTLYDVAPAIQIQGETSARVIGKNGSNNNWAVNKESATSADTSTPSVSAIPAYRLYDKIRGEHIYTYSAAERKALLQAGWTEEPSTIKVLPVSSATGVTVYRIYNPNFGGTHMYSTDPSEVAFLLQSGWKEGTPVFKAAESASASAKPVYRLKNPNSRNGEHQFTTSAAEKAMLLNNGWKNEGIAFYSFN